MYRVNLQHNNYPPNLHTAATLPWGIASSKTVRQHGVYQTIEILQRETLKFIYPDLWLQNSPHLYPVDYRIWAVMLHDRVYQTPLRDVAHLMQRLKLN